MPEEYDAGGELPTSPVCSRWPTCEGYLDTPHALDPHWEYPGDCTWPECSTPPTKGTPTP